MKSIKEKLTIKIFVFLFFSALIIGCASADETDTTEVVPVQQKTDETSPGYPKPTDEFSSGFPKPTDEFSSGYSKPKEETKPTETGPNTDNNIVFRGDAPTRLLKSLSTDKVDIVSVSDCRKYFNGCCLPRPLSFYNPGFGTQLYDISPPMNRDVNCEMWFSYMSEDGLILGFPVDYNSKKNSSFVNGIYYECFKEDNRFWIPNLQYYHPGWRSETFDYVMDFAPTKLIKFKQKFCRIMAVPTDLRTKFNKLFPLEISENTSYKVYSENPFEDIIMEYKDVVEGINNFADFYYFDRLDFLKDKFANAAFLIRDNETHYPVEGAKVVITPLFETTIGKEVMDRFSDFALRAPNFDFGLYGFKRCATEKYLSQISMQNKLFTYFSDYGINPWAILDRELVAFTNKNGEIYWVRNNLITYKNIPYAELFKTPLFSKNITPKGFYYAMETNKKYRISIIHPKYQYFIREFSINKDSQIIIDLAQTTYKIEQVKGKGNIENMFIREITLRQ